MVNEYPETKLSFQSVHIWGTSTSVEHYAKTTVSQPFSERPCHFIPALSIKEKKKPKTSQHKVVRKFQQTLVGAELLHHKKT